MDYLVNYKHVPLVGFLSRQSSLNIMAKKALGGKTVNDSIDGVMVLGVSSVSEGYMSKIGSSSFLENSLVLWLWT